MQEKNLAALSVSHEDASIELIDKFKKIREKTDTSWVEEEFVLDTCNRHEHYLVYNESDWRRYKQYLVKMTEEFRGGGLRVFSGSQATKHAMEVASGLDSAVLGDNQVLGQFKDQFQQQDIRDGVLREMYESSIQVAKKIREETSLNEGARSLSAAAVNLADEKVEDFEEKNIAIIGAGQMGEELLKTIAPRSNGEIYIVNRTKENCTRLLDRTEYKAECFPLEALDEVLYNSQVVFSATAAPGDIVNKDNEAYKDTLFIDLANPRDINLPEEYNVIDLDEINQIVEAGRENRAEESEIAEEYIDEALRRFETKLDHRVSEEIISEFFEDVETKKEKHVSRAIAEIDSRDKKLEDTLYQMAESFINDVMSKRISNIKEAAENGEKEKLEAVDEILNG